MLFSGLFCVAASRLNSPRFSFRLIRLKVNRCQAGKLLDNVNFRPINYSTDVCHRYSFLSSLTFRTEICRTPTLCDPANHRTTDMTRFVFTVIDCPLSFEPTPVVTSVDVFGINPERRTVCNSVTQDVKYSPADSVDPHS